jgi:hypothetical protein
MECDTIDKTGVPGDFFDHPTNILAKVIIYGWKPK